MPTFPFHARMILSGLGSQIFLHVIIITVSSSVQLPSCAWKMLFPCIHPQPLAPTIFPIFHNDH